MKKVSVVVVTDNSGNQILEFLKNIEEQTIGMAAVEIIIVDNNSTDDTCAMVKGFCGRYPCDIVLVEKKVKSTVGECRNIAIELLTGEYVLFMNPCDHIVGDGLQRMYCAAQHTTYEVVECGFECHGEHMDKARERIEQSCILNPIDVEQRKKWIRYVPKISVVGKLIKRDLLIREKLRFPKCRQGESFYLTGKILLLADSYTYVAEKLYQCGQDPDDISMAAYDGADCREIIKVKEDFLQELKIGEENIFNIYRDELEWYIFYNTYYLPILCLCGEIYHYRDSIKSYFPDIRDTYFLSVLDERHAEFMSYFEEQDN